VNPLVLDASAYVLGFTASTPAARHIREQIRARTVHAPHLIVAEVGSVARRMTAGSEIKPDRGLALVRQVSEVATRLHPHGPLARLAWSLRPNVSYYDALYVALAAALGHPLLTYDARLARAPGLPCAVELVA
jgi:predicted nucleic acid-binding protein